MKYDILINELQDTYNEKLKVKEALETKEQQVITTSKTLQEIINKTKEEKKSLEHALEILKKYKFKNVIKDKVIWAIYIFVLFLVNSIASKYILNKTLFNYTILNIITTLLYSLTIYEDIIFNKKNRQILKTYSNEEEISARLLNISEKLQDIEKEYQKTESTLQNITEQKSNLNNTLTLLNDKISLVKYMKENAIKELLAEEFTTRLDAKFEIDSKTKEVMILNREIKKKEL